MPNSPKRRSLSPEQNGALEPSTYSLQEEKGVVAYSLTPYQGYSLDKSFNTIYFLSEDIDIFALIYLPAHIKKIYHPANLTNLVTVDLLNKMHVTGRVSIEALSPEYLQNLRIQFQGQHASVSVSDESILEDSLESSISSYASSDLYEPNQEEVIQQSPNDIIQQLEETLRQTQEALKQEQEAHQKTAAELELAMIKLAYDSRQMNIADESNETLSVLQRFSKFNSDSPPSNSVNSNFEMDHKPKR